MFEDCFIDIDPFDMHTRSGVHEPPVPLDEKDDGDWDYESEEDDFEDDWDCD